MLNLKRELNFLMVLCFALAIPRAMGGTEAEIIAALDEAAQEGTWGYVPLSGPYIDKNISRNVTVQAGKTAVLSCRILYIVGKTVSWIRARDLHLLTVGSFTYTSDERFKAVHQSGSDDWLLKIHYVQKRDSGVYECQVSTTPPISYNVTLTVVEPQTSISGGPDLYINSGSTINLVCEVNFSPEPPPYIFWYHDDKLLSYDRDRSGTYVVTEHNTTGSVSRLIIDKASTKHSGKYICSPATAPQHSINVHIIHRKDEEPAAIHHKNTTSSSSIPSSGNPKSDSIPESNVSHSVTNKQPSEVVNNSPIDSKCSVVFGNHIFLFNAFSFLICSAQYLWYIDSILLNRKHLIMQLLSR